MDPAARVSKFADSLFQIQNNFARPGFGIGPAGYSRNATALWKGTRTLFSILELEPLSDPLFSSALADEKSARRTNPSVPGLGLL